MYVFWFAFTEKKKLQEIRRVLENQACPYTLCLVPNSSDLPRRWPCVEVICIIIGVLFAYVIVLIQYVTIKSYFIMGGINYLILL